MDIVVRASPTLEGGDPKRKPLCLPVGRKALTMAQGKPTVRVAAPSEMMISDKWDSLFEQLVIKTGIGAAVGFALSSVLFGANRPRGRIGLGMFAAGIGSGMAWERAAKEFEK